MSIKTLSIAALTSLCLSSAWAQDKTSSERQALKHESAPKSSISREGFQSQKQLKEHSLTRDSLTKKKSSRSSIANRVEKPETQENKSLKKDRKLTSSSELKQTRSALVTKSSRASHFSFYDARAYLLDDIDGDGYYSEFEIEFDADTIYDWAEVYAQLYIRRGAGDWVLYHTTRVFDIYGTDGGDDYSVATVLNFDYPTGDYDILIDLYEVGFSDIVATWSSYEDADLYALPLEDRNHESAYSSGFEFYDINTDLLFDNDGDGFYSEFAMSFDIDTEYASADVYAEIYFLNEDGYWEQEYTTDIITLQGNSTLDTVHVEFIWEAGYPAGYYDFKIVVRDAYSDERLVETYSEFGALNAVPLESVDYDDYPDSGNSGGSGGNHGGGSSTSYESGGSWGWIMFLLLSLGAGLRKR
ncbi:choice-of-anchor H family protein [Pleionea sediminis]|uniref:choice-of-anchor H family protein n=1 Tax=Pleionea sediminis TaxID=2569479 RepID=UPI0011859404|nr:choice-of-anchor H family protein [Pleionea sediminis]